MFCMYCGTQNTEDSVFCSSCGKRQTGESEGLLPVSPVKDSTQEADLDSATAQETPPSDSVSTVQGRSSPRRTSSKIRRAVRPPARRVVSRRAAIIGTIGALVSIAVTGTRILQVALSRMPADAATLYTYSGHSDIVDGVAWSPDGKRIASGSVDQTVQVWQYDKNL